MLWVPVFMCGCMCDASVLTWLCADICMCDMITDNVYATYIVVCDIFEHVPTFFESYKLYGLTLRLSTIQILWKFRK